MSRCQTDDWPDAEEDAEDELDGEWELDPNDPTHPDYDLSEAAGYADWQPSPKPVLLWRGTMLLLALLVILGLLYPVFLRLAD